MKIAHKLINGFATLLLGCVCLFGLLYGANYVFDVGTRTYDGFCARVDEGAHLCLHRDVAPAATPAQ
jgi:hypothetical protein